MLTLLVVSVLTALAALAVVLTRVRLGAGRDAAGRPVSSGSLLRVHTVAGLVAVAIWVVFLASGPLVGEGAASVVGIVALAFWWVTAGAGLLILVRWLPSKGRHSSAGAQQGRAAPALSVLAHVGVLAAVVVFTWVYLVEAV